MSVSNINIRVDSEVKAQAQDLFASLGLDMTTAITIFLRHVIRQQGIPFVVSMEPAPKMPKPGCMKGKIGMSDDFDGTP